MIKYKHILFDFDNTLWDFDKNSKESLLQVFEKYKMIERFESFETFYEIFEKHNLALWADYRNGLLDKYALGLYRFSRTLETVKVKDADLALKLNSEYLANTTLKTELIPNAFEILYYLREKYDLHIVTNGFYEVQFLKLRNSKLESFFKNLITSEEANALKPNPIFFKYTLEKLEATPENCIIIGDNYETDILGARNANIDQIFFNRYNENYISEKPTFEINSLLELKNIL